MGFLTRFSKYILLLFNLVILVCALILIVEGIIMQVKKLISPADYAIEAYSIFVGLIIFFVAFLGCCGAARENSFMLTLYAFIMIIFFIIQLLLGILCFLSLRNANKEFDTRIKESLTRVFDSKDQKKIDNIQQTFECCGIDGPEYWKNQIPKSCYKDDSSKKLYERGCVEGTQDYFVTHIKATGVTAILFAIVELLAAIFAYIVKDTKTLPPQTGHS